MEEGVEEGVERCGPLTRVAEHLKLEPLARGQNAVPTVGTMT